LRSRLVTYWGSAAAAGGGRAPFARRHSSNG
jgi:hypothetical protein